MVDVDATALFLVDVDQNALFQSVDVHFTALFITPDFEQEGSFQKKMWADFINYKWLGGNIYS